MMTEWTLVRACGAIGLVCAAWNLLGDLYYMDFYTAHLSMENFAMIRDHAQSGYLFNFDKSQWLVFVAQSGGWMYPIWAFATAVPLFIGLREREFHGCPPFGQTVAPCAVLAYGLCIIGGGLHSSFAFLTVLPSVYHYSPASNDSGDWSDLEGRDDFFTFLDVAQTRILQHLGVGCLPGLVACNVAYIWIAVVVQYYPTQFPKIFNIFNPMVTTIWVQILGAVLPEPLGFYFAGCLGTWGILIFNLTTTYFLWDDARGIESVALLMHDKQGGSNFQGTGVYNSVQRSQLS